MSVLRRWLLLGWCHHRHHPSRLLLKHQNYSDMSGFRFRRYHSIDWKLTSLPNGLYSNRRISSEMTYEKGCLLSTLPLRRYWGTKTLKTEGGRIPKGFEKFFKDFRWPLRPPLSAKQGQEMTPNDSDPKKLRTWIPFIIAAILLGITSYLTDLTDHKEITWQEFKRDLLERGLVDKLTIEGKSKVIVTLLREAMTPEAPKSYYFYIGSIETFERQLEEAQRDLGKDPQDFLPVLYTKDSEYSGIGARFLESIIAIAAWLLLMRLLMGMGGGGGSGGKIGGSTGPRSVFSFGKSIAKMITPEMVDVKFSDVAGMDEAKQEIMEFVNFLKNPEFYKTLGAKIPKGALLSGPPGTGKTLLAKATAGESNVPFLSVSGSEFLEMFVGVGPSRVRDLFEQARSHAPCIVFIDEIDAIGRARGRSTAYGGSDERESTLNQILVELDGFGANTNIIVLAGTNRPDILDPALLRPGRFDRQIYIDKPDIKGRKEIALVYLKKIKTRLDKKQMANRVALLTPGFTGADIANVCNESALIAARDNSTSVEEAHFEQAVERVISGIERKSRVLSAEEKKTIAYHEAGHAVAGWFLQHADPLIKVSIIPRSSSSLGSSRHAPREKFLYSIDELLDRMCVALGGRVSEIIFFGQASTSAQDDLAKITEMAYAQIAQFGMDKKVGNISFPKPDKNEPILSKPYSEATACLIDKEVRNLLDKVYERTLQMLRQKSDLVKKVAEALLEKEVLRREDLVELLGPRPFQEDLFYEKLLETDN